MPKENAIVVVGTSAGGTLMLPELLKQINETMDVAVFVVIHLSKHDIGDMLAKRLQKKTVFPCTIAEHNEEIKTKHIYISRPDHHLMIKKNKILLGRGPMENRYRPSIDVLFRSAAAQHDHLVIGIVLTGMLEDGAAGMQAIKRAGGVCIVQDPNEAKYPDMPMAVLTSLKPDYVIPIEEMGAAIAESIVKQKKKKGKKVPPDITKEADIAERVSIGIDKVSQLGERSLFSCPDCGGGLWEIGSNGDRRFRCHVGHAYTEAGLLSGMEASTESALWTALRIIEERRNLLQKIADKEKKEGKRRVTTNYNQRIKELETQIHHLRKILFITESDSE
jgi:two-component system chemotaxis response regulator CheB